MCRTSIFVKSRFNLLNVFSVQFRFQYELTFLHQQEEADHEQNMMQKKKKLLKEKDKEKQLKQEVAIENL